MCCEQTSFNMRTLPSSVREVRKMCVRVAGVMPSILKEGREWSFFILRTVPHVMRAQLIIFQVNRLIKIP